MSGKICNKCKKEKSAVDFYWDSYNGRYRVDCKDCHFSLVTKTNIKYRKTQNGKKKITEASKRAFTNHREKWLARARLRYAVKIGKVVKAKKCEICQTVKPLQGHHTDYTKPLQVMWLCSGCHRAEHKRFNQ